MPVSSAEGKDWTVERIVRLWPKTILDVGVGAGIYATLLRPLLPIAKFIGIEIWEPYVARFDLDGRYEELHITNVLDLVPLPTCDVLILGDVLEHLVYADALILWQRAREAARSVFLSLPIVEYPQGEVDGNPHEAHLHTWSHDQVLALPGITDWYSPPWPHIVGAYEARGDR